MVVLWNIPGPSPDKPMELRDVERPCGEGAGDGGGAVAGGDEEEGGAGGGGGTAGADAEEEGDGLEVGGAAGAGGMGSGGWHRETWEPPNKLLTSGPADGAAAGGAAAGAAAAAVGGHSGRSMGAAGVAVAMGAAGGALALALGGRPLAPDDGDDDAPDELLGPLLDKRDIFERVLLPLLDPTSLAMLGRAGNVALRSVG